MFIRIRIALARHEAKVMSKAAPGLKFTASVKGWMPAVGAYKSGKRVRL